MKFCLISTLLLAAAMPAAAAQFSLKSPDGRITADVDRSLVYTVSLDGRQVFTGTVAITLADGAVVNSVRSPRYISVDTEVPSPLYRSATVKDRYNQLTLTASKDWMVEFRAYDDGVAYRWVYRGRRPVTIADETVKYDFPADAGATVGYIRADRCTDLESMFFSSFENDYTATCLSGLDSTRLAFTPLLVEPSDSVNVLITESDQWSYPGMFLASGADRSLRGVFAPYPRKTRIGGWKDFQLVVEEREPYIARLDGARPLPWRMAVITDDHKGLAASDMTYLLASPSQIDDISWIKPGKVAWDWWNFWNITGVDFEAGPNQQTYKHYIDFAAENGIEYIIMDEGWSVPGATLYDVIPEINLPELLEYASGRGVGIILWGTHAPFADDFEGIARHYAGMGVKGFKVDFFDRNDQEVEEFIEKIARIAADNHLVLDLHGYHIPAGITRRWPNILNTEGVNGLERMKGYDIRLDQVKYDTYIPFIRQVAGPMDYTQGAMRNGTRESYHPSDTQPMSQGTRCHQLALYPILDSPLNMLCDSPTNYRREQECTDFIAAIPTVWDETRVLAGQAGEYCVMARRSGDTWYVGGITDWTPRTLKVDLGWLPAGEYEAEWYVDGRNAHRDATDYRRIVEPLTYVSKSICLAPGGGFAAKISKK